jgi:hypothetical protein
MISARFLWASITLIMDLIRLCLFESNFIKQKGIVNRFVFLDILK